MTCIFLHLVKAYCYPENVNKITSTDNVDVKDFVKKTNKHIIWGTWLAYWVKHLTLDLTQIFISGSGVQTLNWTPHSAWSLPITSKFSPRN